MLQIECVFKSKIQIKGGGSPGVILGNGISFFYMPIKPFKGPLICRSNEVSTPIGAKVMGVQIFGGPRPQNFKMVSA